MRPIFLISIVGLVGCAPSAIIVRTHGTSTSQNAPVNENESKGGTVKYDPDRSSGRDTAYQEMHDFCKGPYKITNENVAHEGYVYTNVMTGQKEYGTGNFVYMNFECVSNPTVSLEDPKELDPNSLKAYQKEVTSSEFGKAYYAVVDGFSSGDFGVEQEEAMRIKEKLSNGSGKKTEEYFDKDTGHQISEGELSRRMFLYSVDTLVVFFHANESAYRADYSRLVNLNKKYPKVDNLIVWPGVGADGKVDLRKYKNDMLTKLNQQWQH